MIHNPLCLYSTLFDCLIHPIRYFKYVYISLKFFIQRGARGYADCDIWDIGDYLSAIIPSMLKEQRSIQRGHICSQTSQKDVKIVDMDNDHCSKCDQLYDQYIKGWEMIRDFDDYSHELLRLIVQEPFVPTGHEFHDKFMKIYHENISKFQVGKTLITDDEYIQRIESYKNEYKNMLHLFIDNIESLWD
jgi:hypothetical protein